VRFLAEVLGVPRRDVVLLAGESGKRKRVEVRGVSVDTLLGAFASSLTPS